VKLAPEKIIITLWLHGYNLPDVFFNPGKLNGSDFEALNPVPKCECYYKLRGATFGVSRAFHQSTVSAQKTLQILD
jgi:hypothetical protein